MISELQIIPVPWKFKLYLMNFIIINREIFQTNLPIHKINTSNKHYLHKPNTNLSDI